MITPEQVIVKKFNPDWDKYEIQIDLELKVTWYENEERKIMLRYKEPEVNDQELRMQVVNEMIKRYRAAGWRCRLYGYSFLAFQAPKLKDDSSANKKRWLFW